MANRHLTGLRAFADLDLLVSPALAAALARRLWMLAAIAGCGLSHRANSATTAYNRVPTSSV